MELITFLTANKVILLTLALSISELLALVPSVQSNSIFQLVFSLFKKAAGK